MIDCIIELSNKVGLCWNTLFDISFQTFEKHKTVTLSVNNTVYNTVQYFIFPKEQNYSLSTVFYVNT